jgi:hypothetical protein
MRSLVDEMAAAGRKLDDAELVEYILTGLDYNYNPIISALGAQMEHVSVDELSSSRLRRVWSSSLVEEITLVLQLIW